MSGFVLDASVALAWCFDDESTPAAWTLLDRLRDAPAHVPALWALEVGNILLGAERRRRITQARATEFLGILGDLDIRTDPELPGRAFRDVLPLARAHRLTAYDATYLELAMRLGLPLASKDAALRRAATALHLKTLGA
ncbi:MAG TPA: type II toxin-antitoxin system VapC family toxin [Burkholderiaceae bacterium]|nr:type II toxin-antitoxin system VapC family toxin [Burkholderiaceae bacterium]